MEAMFSIKQAADLLGLSDRTVRWHCLEGRIGTQVGGGKHRRYVITASQIKRFKKMPRQVGNPNFRKGA